MNFTDYDNALKSKLTSVFDNVVNSSEEKALESSEDEEVMVNLPLISFWRLSNNISTEGYSSFGSTRGLRNKASDPTVLVSTQAAFELTYQVNIWSDRLYEVDQILSEIVQFFNEEPYLDVVEPNFDDGVKFYIKITECELIIQQSEFSETGKLYQQALTLVVDRALLLYPQNKQMVKNIPIRTFSVKGDKSYED